jgi:hypothetical protein
MLYVLSLENKKLKLVALGCNNIVAKREIRSEERGGRRQKKREE